MEVAAVAGFVHSQILNVARIFSFAGVLEKRQKAQHHNVTGQEGAANWMRLLPFIISLLFYYRYFRVRAAADRCVAPVCMALHKHCINVLSYKKHAEEYVPVQELTPPWGFPLNWSVRTNTQTSR